MTTPAACSSLRLSRAATRILRLALALFAVAIAGPLIADESDLRSARPVPLMQAVPQPYDQVSLQRDGHEIARYHFGPSLRRPFIFPLLGPAGRSLTRMGHPRDPDTHSHHNSVWVAHQDVAGVNFWEDRGPGRIVHQRVVEFEDADDRAAVVSENAWKDIKTGRTLMLEQRTTAVQPLPAGEFVLLIELEWRAPGDDSVVLGKTPFGPLGVRMAKTIGVHDGGGRLLNSAGQSGEKEIFRKPARWVDYSGPIAGSQIEGITLFDHPQNPGHPTAFHVRSDGWMGPSLTLNTPITVEPGQPLRLRYGLYVHRGLQEVEDLERRWQEFAAGGSR